MAPLAPELQRRGRRLAISSHPLGMTFAMVMSEHLPTLALVSLGASESVVGLQSAVRAAEVLKLPTLRAVARFSKRSILVAGQIGALVAAIPLLFFGTLSRMGGDGGGPGVAIAVTSLIAVACCVRISETVWFPLLRSYVEPARIGQFFGLLRSGWHLALIGYYFAARAWLAARPGDYAPLFGLAWLCGLVRVFMIVRLPERSERTGAAIRIREALALVRESAPLRRYLLGVGWCYAVRGSVVPFVLVMMRREVGFGADEVLYTTVASFAGGLASLYLWGHVVDRFGPAPVFRFTAIGMGILIAGLQTIDSADASTLALLIAFFFLHTALAAGFGVADTHVIFSLTPEDAPARMLVISAVVVGAIAGLAPIVTGAAIERALVGTTSPLDVYHAFFLVAAVLQACAFLPLRRFGRGGLHPA